MGIIDDLRQLLENYSEDIEGIENGENDSTRYEGIGLIHGESNRHNRFNSIPGALTFSDDHHCFFVEPLQSVVPFKKISDIINKYKGILNENKRAHNIIATSYDLVQLRKDIDENCEFSVFRHTSSMLDLSIHMFCRYFNIFQEGSFDGTNLFYYPIEIREFIDRAINYKTQEENNYSNALSLSCVVKDNLRIIASNSTSPDREIEDLILENLFKLYDKDFYEFKQWASKKSGYGIGGHIAIRETDWQSIVDDWNAIKKARPNIFTSNRYIPDPSYGQSYGNAGHAAQFFDVVDAFFKSTNLESAWIAVSNGVYSAFYNKPNNA